MKNQIQTLLNKIAQEYNDWVNDSPAYDHDHKTARNRAIKKFTESLSYETGRKYIRIFQGNSIWGFVVNTDKDKKFRKGDILKAASWATPARNSARGNILDGGYEISWTGPYYLK